MLLTVYNFAPLSRRRRCSEAQLHDQQKGLRPMRHRWWTRRLGWGSACVGPGKKGLLGGAARRSGGCSSVGRRNGQACHAGASHRPSTTGTLESNARTRDSDMSWLIVRGRRRWARGCAKQGHTFTEKQRRQLQRGQT